MPTVFYFKENAAARVCWVPTAVKGFTAFVFIPHSPRDGGMTSILSKVTATGEEWIP